MRTSILARHSDYYLNTEMARWATAAIFFIYGARMSTWYVYIPFVPSRFGISESVIGWLFLVMSIGAVLGVLISSPMISRTNSRAVSVIGTGVMLFVVPIMVLTDSLLVFAAAGLVYGLGTGVVDIAMNAQGTAVQFHMGRPLMSSLHGAYSVGTLFGGLVGAIAIGLRVSPAVHTMGFLMFLGMLTLFAAFWLMPPVHEPAHEKEGATFTMPHGALFWLGVLAFGAFMAEEVIASWGGIYMRTGLQAAEPIVPLGYLLFTLMMTTGRMMGDRLIANFRPIVIFRVSGLLAGLGLAVALWLHHPWAALVGFALAGLGISNFTPLVIDAAGRLPGYRSSTAISAASSVGYVSFLVGPPLVGYVAEGLSLSAAIGIVVLISFGMAGAARLVARR